MPIAAHSSASLTHWGTFRLGNCLRTKSWTYFPNSSKSIAYKKSLLPMKLKLTTDRTEAKAQNEKAIDSNRHCPTSCISWQSLIWNRILWYVSRLAAVESWKLVISEPFLLLMHFKNYDSHLGDHGMKLSTAIILANQAVTRTVDRSVICVHCSRR